MSITNWDVINIFTEVFETLVIFMFIDGFLEIRNNSIKIRALTRIFFFVCLVSINNFIHIPILTLTSVMALIFFITYFYYGNIKTKLFAVLLLMLFSIASEMISLLSIMTYNRIDTAEALNEGTFRILGILISKVILLVLTRIVCLYRKRIQYVKIDFAYWVAIFMIPIISTLTLYVIFIFNDHIGSGTYSPLSTLTAMGILYSNIAVFYLFESIIDKTSIKLKNNLLEQQVQYQFIHSKENELAQKQTRAYRHDMKNHLILLKDMISTNKNQEAINYINNIYDIVFNITHEIFTGNIAIDSVLNAKLALAKNLNIEVEKTIQVPGDLKLDPIDSCILFGNIMDNAIEACSRIESGAKKIELFLAYKNNSLICRVINTTDDHVQKEGHIYLSSKKSYNQPGIGLENIFNTVRKYDGTINTEHKNRFFNLSFIIYNL